MPHDFAKLPKAKLRDSYLKKANKDKLISLDQLECYDITLSHLKEIIKWIHQNWTHHNWKGFAALILPYQEKWEIEGFITSQ